MNPDLAWIAGVLTGSDPRLAATVRRRSTSDAPIAEFAVLPSSRDPRLVVERPGNAVLSAALRRTVRGSGPASGLVRRAWARAISSGLLVPRSVLRIDPAAGSRPGTNASDLLTGHLRDVLGDDDLRSALTVGPLRPNRKPVVQVMAPDGRLVAYAKVGADESTARLVRNEASVLEELARHPPEGFLAPTCTHAGTWKDLTVLVMGPLDLEALAAPSSMPLGALRSVASYGGIDTRELANLPWWERLRERALRLETGREHPSATATSTRLADAIDAAERDSGGDVIPCGFGHGDWTPWNMAEQPDGAVVIWDWERAGHGVPVGLDVAHWCFQTRFANGGSEITDAVSTMRRDLPDFLGRLGVPTAGPDVVARLYLLELSMRYAESTVEGSAVLQRTTDDLLDALAGLSGSFAASRSSTSKGGLLGRLGLGRRTLGGRSLPAPVREGGRYAARAWMRPTAKLRRFPDFLIVGAQRSGTTSLYRYLVQHPAITGPALGKGVHYFDTNFTRGPQWYRSHFQLAADDGVVACEASPYYLFHPLVPARVAGLLPDMKIVLILREPGDRAYSHHRHEVARGFEDLPFEQALDREEDRLRGEVERLRADPSYVSHSHQHYSYKARGMYDEQLERYFNCFAPEQILIHRYEDLAADPSGVTARTCEFLGLDPPRGIDYPVYNARPGDEIDPMVRGVLDAHFKEANSALARRLGWSELWA